MKRLLLIICLTLPLSLAAQKVTDPKYLAGAVPTENGFVCFKQDFSAPGKSKADIFKALQEYTLTEIVKGANHLGESRFTEVDEEAGIISASIEETLYFRRAAWVTHSTRFLYQLIFHVEDGRFAAEMRRLRYVYEGKDDVAAVEQSQPAESWITDEEALTKDRKKLTRIGGKFRKNTIDRKDQIFAGAAAAVGAQHVTP